MSCLSWLRRSYAVPVNDVNIPDEGTSSTDSSDINVRSSAGIPGGLAGIKYRMKELGHFMNESNLSDPALQSREAGRTSQTETNSSPSSVGKDGNAAVTADFCNDRGQPVDATLPTRTEGSVLQPLF